MINIRRSQGVGDYRDDYEDYQADLALLPHQW